MIMTTEICIDRLCSEAAYRCTNILFGSLLVLNSGIDVILL